MVTVLGNGKGERERGEGCDNDKERGKVGGRWSVDTVSHIVAHSPSRLGRIFRKNILLDLIKEEYLNT